jgi:hypothetical protein
MRAFDDPDVIHVEDRVVRLALQRRAHRFGRFL